MIEYNVFVLTFHIFFSLHLGGIKRANDWMIEIEMYKISPVVMTKMIEYSVSI